MDNDNDRSSPAHNSKSNPDRSQITAALRSTVQKWFRENPELVTVGSARTHVEQELGLDPGFLKEDSYWSKEAKAIVKAEFTSLTEAVSEAEESPAPKKKPAKKPPAKKVAAKPRAKKAVEKKSIQDEPVGDDAAVKQDRDGETSKLQPKKGGRPAAPKKDTPKRVRGKPTVGEDEDEDAGETVAAPVPAAAPEVTPGSDSELSDVPASPPKKLAKRSTNVAKKPAPKRARAKPTVDEDDDEVEPTTAPEPIVNSDSELSDITDEPPKKKPGKRSLSSAGPAKKDSPKKKAKVSPKSKPKEEAPDGPERPSTPLVDDAGSDSDMSLVLDPTPQKGRSITGKVRAPKKTKSPKAPQARKGKAKKADSKEDAPLDPEQEQLKTLKAWLLKCGIRKVWSRELAKFDTPRAQIAHLRSLLSEIGMTGRYSAEKAKKIKEERELRAEVEAVQLGASEWGHEEEEGRRKVSTRSMRNVPAVKTAEKKEIRGMEDLAFLDGQSDSD